MRSYAEALRHHEKAYKPPRSKKWKVMIDDARAIDSVRATHYAIHKRADGVIYYRLYDTNVATFYPPDANGVERRTFKWVNTCTTSKFMWLHGLNFGQVEMDDGAIAQIPYVTNGGWRDNDMVTADLYVNADNKVIRSLSSHKDVYTMVSSPEDKAKRKAIRGKFNPLITLATFNLANLKANAELDEYLGGPFALAHNTPTAMSRFKNWVRLSYKPNDEESENMFTAKLMEALQDFFNVFASRVAYNNGGFDRQYFHYDRENKCMRPDEERIRLTTEHNAKMEIIRKDILENITAEGFAKSLSDAIISAMGAKTGSVKKPWGQFMPKLPVKWIA